MRAFHKTVVALLQIYIITLVPEVVLADADLKPPHPMRGNRGVTSKKPKLQDKKSHVRPEAPGDKVLIFWATGASKDTVDLIKKNVEHARQELPHVSIFLAHYDHRQDKWQDLAGKKWYQENVDNSVQQDGYKFQLLKSLVSERVITVMDYDWVWVLDEDADFRRTPLQKMLQLASESGALISTPAFTSTTGSKDMSYPFQQPRQDCRLRYAPVVEVTFPLFRAEALKGLMTECDHCMGKNSVWGLCRMWCSWSARRKGKDKSKACAILDGAPMVHRDFRTLNGKYTDSQPYGLQGAIKSFNHGFLAVNQDHGHNRTVAEQEHPGSQGFYNMAKREYAEVQKYHPNDFVSTKGAEMKELSCVKNKL